MPDPAGHSRWLGTALPLPPTISTCSCTALLGAKWTLSRDKNTQQQSPGMLQSSLSALPSPLSSGCSKLREALSEPTSGSALNEQNTAPAVTRPQQKEKRSVKSLDNTVKFRQCSPSLQQPALLDPSNPLLPPKEAGVGGNAEATESRSPAVGQG